VKSLLHLAELAPLGQMPLGATKRTGRAFEDGNLVMVLGNFRRHNQNLVVAWSVLFQTAAASFVVLPGALFIKLQDKISSNDT